MPLSVKAQNISGKELHQADVCVSYQAFPVNNAHRTDGATYNPLCAVYYMYPLYQMTGISSRCGSNL